MTSTKVNEPEAPAVTLTDGPSVGPTIVPLPVIDQLWVTTPPDGVTVEVKILPVELQFTGLGPAIAQVGGGVIGKFEVHWPGHPYSVTLYVRVNETEGAEDTISV